MTRSPPSTPPTASMATVSGGINFSGILDSAAASEISGNDGEDALGMGFLGDNGELVGLEDRSSACRLRDP